MGKGRTWTAAAVVVGVVACAAPTTSAIAKAKPRAQAQSVGAVLREGQTLKPGDGLRSRNRRFALRMQSDGNLVLTTDHGRKVRWDTQSGGNRGAAAVLQKDGNFVLYNSARQPIYASGTHGRGHRLVLQDDGNLVLVDAGNAPLWSALGDITTMQVGQLLRAGQSRRSANGAYVVVMQPDGNLVVYERATRTPLWSSLTNGHPGAHAAFGADGNLVVLDVDGTPLYWSASVTGGPGSRLVMQDDGNLVVYGGDKAARWSSKVDTYALTPGQELHAGQWRRSPNGRFQLDAQGDGNLVLREVATHAALWSSQTNVAGGFATLQTDGNFVVYGPDRRPVWSIGFQAGPNTTLVVQDDGNVVLYDPADKAVWSTGTGGR
jgi:hypothetical protein